MSKYIYTCFIHSYISRLACITLFNLVLEGWFMHRSCNNSLRMAKHVECMYVKCVVSGSAFVGSYIDLNHKLGMNNIHFGVI